MRIKNKLFPYPVLATQIDDYNNNCFEGEIIVEKNMNNIRFILNITIEDKQIIKMINIEEINIIYHFECAKTLYRQIFKTNKFAETIDINESKLNGKVEICCILVAKKKLVQYSNSNFNSDYGNTKFDVKKGNILGFYNFPLVNIIKNTEELAKVSSIFSIHHRIASDDLGMEIELGGDKIIIWLADEEYKKYSENANNPTYQPILHAMLIFPALLYALDMIVANDVGEYEDCRWFLSLQRKLKESKIELSKEVIKEKKPFWIAQNILDLPINRAMKNMEDRLDEEEE